MGVSDLMVDIRQIGRVDPTVAEVDLIRLRAGALLATDSQLTESILSKAERAALTRIASTDYDISAKEILNIRDLRLAGAERGRVGGFQGDSFTGAQTADDIARLLEIRTRGRS